MSGQKRLGRGLAALLGDAAAPQSATAAGVQNLPVDLLEPSPYQPRRDMDEAALQELADSIAQRGILQPLLVRPKPGVAGSYQIIAGERRWRAAQKVALHDVPVLVRDLSDADAMAAGLVENLQREDLNPIEEAEGYQRLIEEFKLTQEALADAVGKSRGHINNTLRVLRLPPRVLNYVREGSLTIGHAKALLSHIDPQAGARMIINKGWSVRQAEQFIETMGRRIKPNSAAMTKPHPYEKNGNFEMASLENNLSLHLGLKVKVAFNGKSGSVTISFKDLDQLDHLLGTIQR
jgi:ParB family chromosome partitioning protein